MKLSYREATRLNRLPEFLKQLGKPSKPSKRSDTFQCIRFQWFERFQFDQRSLIFQLSHDL